MSWHDGYRSASSPLRDHDTRPFGVKLADTVRKEFMNRMSTERLTYLEQLIQNAFDAEVKHMPKEGERS